MHHQYALAHSLPIRPSVPTPPTAFKERLPTITVGIAWCPPSFLPPRSAFPIPLPSPMYRTHPLATEPVCFASVQGASELCVPGNDKLCPAGYDYIVGDKPGWGDQAAGGSTPNVLSIAACATLCGANSNCLSFEYYPTSKVCNRNEARLPDAGSRPHEDSAFCSKPGTVSPPSRRSPESASRHRS